MVTDDIRNLMNLLSWIRKEDVFVFGTFLRVPDACLCDLELKYTDDRHRLLVKVRDMHASHSYVIVYAKTNHIISAKSLSTVVLSIYVWMAMVSPHYNLLGKPQFQFQYAVNLRFSRLNR